MHIVYKRFCFYAWFNILSLFINLMCVGLISIQFKCFLCFAFNFVFYFGYIRTDITRIRIIYDYFMGFRMCYKLEQNPKCFYPNLKCYYPNMTRTNIILEKNLGEWTRKPRNPKYPIRTRTCIRTLMLKYDQDIFIVVNYFIYISFSLS